MERLDDILGYENLKIYQNSDYFSFSLDSIILANYATIRMRDKKIVDFCTGNGVVPIIVSKRTNSDIVGVEIQDNIAALAQKSIQYNHLENRIQIVHQDVKKFAMDHLNEFDLVLCNPPYFKVEDNSSFNLSYEKMVARHEVLFKLEDVFDCAKKILKDNGNIALVHRCDRLMDILSLLRDYHFEPKRIRFLFENVNKESTLVLIEGQKCGKPGLIIDKPFIQYNLDGSMTDEYKKLQEEICL